MKRFFSAQFPFWSVLLLVCGIMIGMLAVFSQFREKVFNYVLSVPGGSSAKVEELAYGEQPSLSNPDFFQKVKKDFLDQKASFIEADLSQKKIFVYQNGEPAIEVPILTIGKEGSWWETPAGIYKILTKEKSHFSSFGKVYQPWSMSFQGNFFIHGWPHYPDGTPVATTYSGGCIRLSDEDAKKVYDLSDVGMPVLVFKEAFAPDTFQYQARIPDMTADKYLVADVKNNFVFMEKGKADTIPFGSFSQFLGALVSTDYINIERDIRLNADFLKKVEGERYFSGESVTPYDLLYPMLLQSDSSPLRIFSNYLGEQKFVSLMNAKAQAVGMLSTEFSFGTTTEDRSYGKTTTEDLFYLGKYAYNNRKFVLDLSAGRLTNKIYGVSVWSDLPNLNIFASDLRFIGGKAVKNEDGTESFFGVFEITAIGEKRPVFIFLDRSQNAETEAKNILEYVTRVYQ